MARSRYGRLEVLDGNHFETLTLEQTNAIKAPDTFDDVRTRRYTVKRGDRLDHLAARFLNDDKYWWAIAMINNLTLPVVTPGQKIRIPFDVVDVLDRI